MSSGALECIKPLALAILLGIAGGLIQGYLFWSLSNDTIPTETTIEWLQHMLAYMHFMLLVISPCIPVIGGSALKLPIAFWLSPCSFLNPLPYYSERLLGIKSIKTFRCGGV
jgi:fatty acid desaturase